MEFNHFELIFFKILYKLLIKKYFTYEIKNTLHLYSFYLFNKKNVVNLKKIMKICSKGYI